MRYYTAACQSVAEEVGAITKKKRCNVVPGMLSLTFNMPVTIWNAKHNSINVACMFQLRNKMEWKCKVWTMNYHSRAYLLKHYRVEHLHCSRVNQLPYLYTPCACVFVQWFDQPFCNVFDHSTGTAACETWSETWSETLKSTKMPGI